MASAFGVNLSLLFIGDGIFQLKKNQQPEHINAKHFTAIFTALDLYDIKQIYATASGLDSRCISAVDLCIPVNIISATALTKLIHQQDVVLNF